MADEPVELVKRGRGQPIAIVEEVIKDLESIFRIGGSVSAACSYARISRQTFYVRMEADEEFANRIENAKNYAVIAARKIVVKTMLETADPVQKVELAKWYLEKHDTHGGATTQTQVNVFQGLRDQFTKKAETEEEPTVIETKEVEQAPEAPAPVIQPPPEVVIEPVKTYKINLNEGSDSDSNEY